MLKKPATANKTDGCFRHNVHLGQLVEVVTKRNQKTGVLTRGNVRWILTSAAYHSRGIKVMLNDRIVGRVQKIILEEA
jgi:uncharacterized repeat protein (TIGR03833 family)